jgi:glycosyltransferase involved in cell wall biosynthesis
VSRSAQAGTTRRPRIALVARNIAEGHTSAVVFGELVRRLGDRVEFVVVSCSPPRALRAIVEWRRVPAPSQFHLRWAVFFLLCPLRIRLARIDLVHASSARPFTPGQVDLMWLHFCHAEYDRLQPPSERQIFRRLIRLLVRILERWCYSHRVRMLAAVSSGQATDLARHFPGVPVSVVPLPLDTERFRPDARTRAELRAKMGVEPHEVVALFVGDNWERKGLDVAVEAVALVRRGGLPLRLWVIGGDPRGSRAAEVMGHAERLDIASRVELLGARSNVERFYQAADVFVLPTLYENHSRAMLEAAASELPLVVAAVNGVAETVGDGEAGIVVPRTPEAVANALLQLGSDPALRAKMGRAGRARVSPYTIKRTVDCTAALYERLLPPELAGCLASAVGELPAQSAADV